MCRALDVDERALYCDGKRAKYGAVWTRMNLPVARGKLPPVVLLLVAVAALAYSGYSLVAWQLSARDADAYMSAKFCAREGSTECKVQVPATIVQTYSRHYNKGEHYFVSLLRTDGTRLPDVEMGTGYSTWVTLTPFMPVTTIYWHGTLVAVMTPVPPAVRTIDHPTYRSDEHKRRGIYSWVAAIVLVALYLMARRFPNISRRRRIGGSGGFSTSPAGFQFEHGDDP